MSFKIWNLPRAFQVLLVGTFINRAGSFTVTFLAANLTGARHVPVEFAGLVLSVLGIGAVFSAPVGGYLADAIGRRATMALSLITGGLCVLALAMTENHVVMLVTSALLGFGGGMYRPASSAAIADLVPAAELQNAYRTLHWTFNLAGSIGAAIAGYLAAISFPLLGAVDAATTMVFALLVLLYIPEKRDDRPTRVGFNLHEPFRDRRFLTLFALSCCWNLVFFQLYSTYAIDLTANGISLDQYGLLFTLNGILIIFLQPLLAGRVNRARPGRALALSSVLIGVGFGATALAPNYGWVIATVVIWSIGEIIASGILQALVSEMAPAQFRGSYHGAILLTFSIGQFLAPFLGTAVLSQFGRTALWGGCAVIALLTALGFLRVRSAFNPGGKRG